MKTTQDIARFTESIFRTTPETFEGMALELFRYQAENNPVYGAFLQYLDILPADINKIADIPFLPISAFKHHQVVTGTAEPAIIFESSGTTGMDRSRHYVSDISLYAKSYVEGFKRVYGDITQYRILALLPSYLERSNASLVTMCAGLIERSGYPDSGFYLHDLESLSKVLADNHPDSTKTLLIGVSFALLDLAEQYAMPLKNTIIMETGGMKGRREEITREALHHTLQSAFHCQEIHSEYGMTELLSQAYSTSSGIFTCPSWMRILIRDSEDPFQILPVGKAGCINVIDFANIHSCSFIATDDLGVVKEDGSFTVTGRFDSSDIRGCNLMIE